MISTVTRVTSSVSHSDEGPSVVLTARVAPEEPHETTPTGTVTFAVAGSDEPLTASLDDDGTATVTTGDLGSGPHEITATYQGDTVFAGSTGVHTLVRIPTSMTITSVPNPSAPGQLVTITATVTPDTPGPGVPTGSVVFTLTGIGNFTVPLNAGGQAILTTTAFVAGEYTITGSYTGDATYLPISQSVPHTVSTAATTTTVTSAPNPSALGETVTVTAHVTPVPPATGTPTGTVTLTIGGTGGETVTVLLGPGDFRDSIVNTLVLGAATATIVVPFTALCAWLVVRRAPGAALLDHLATLPLVFPALILSVAFLDVFVNLPLPALDDVAIHHALRAIGERAPTHADEQH